MRKQYFHAFGVRTCSHGRFICLYFILARYFCDSKTTCFEDFQ